MTQDDLNYELQDAATRLQTDRCRELLAAGADPNGIDERGNTPLHWAAWIDHLEAIPLLLEAGANPNAANDAGKTPLFEASLMGRSEVATLLLEAGADPNGIDERGNTPLHWAAWIDHLEAIPLLLEAGANPNAANDAGKTPLFEASLMGRSEVAALLLERGADLHHKDHEGDTALVEAFRSKTSPAQVKEMVDLLLCAGASLTDVGPGRDFWDRVEDAPEENKRYLRARLTKRRIEDAMGGPSVDPAPAMRNSGPGPL